jgi:hypothetical protein
LQQGSITGAFLKRKIHKYNQIKLESDFLSPADKLENTSSSGDVERFNE